jgi:hypothetical protein
MVHTSNGDHVKYLSPYSPDCDPIGFAWSKLKEPACGEAGACKLAPGARTVPEHGLRAALVSPWPELRLLHPGPLPLPPRVRSWLSWRAVILRTARQDPLEHRTG